jgi:hypothetical protein
MFEGQFDGQEFLLGTGGEVGDGTVFDFAILAEGLAEEDPAIGFAVGGSLRAVEIHSEHIIIILLLICKHYIDILSGYTLGAQYPYHVGLQLFADLIGRNTRFSQPVIYA